MADLLVNARIAYYAPTARRYFFTMKAAARREASAMLSKKYPSERGDEHDSGWHWRSDDRLCTAHDRLMKRIIRRHAQRHGGKV